MAIQELGLQDFVHGHPWLPFPRCRDLLGTAHVLLDLMGPDHQLQISGKLYDYLGAERPILSVSPNPEVGRILTEANAGVRVPCDTNAIVEALTRFLQAKQEGTLAPVDPAGAIAHTAEERSRELAAIFNAVLQGATG